MEETSNPITIIKAKDPDKLIVYHASSRKDEIRFYINETQYITAVEQSDGTAWVDAGEDIEEKENKKSSLTIIKENFKGFGMVSEALSFCYNKEESFRQRAGADQEEKELPGEKRKSVDSIHTFFEYNRECVLRTHSLNLWNCPCIDFN